MLSLLCVVVVPSAAAQTAPRCQFVMGFKTLHDSLPATTGECTDNQAFAANGDAQQPTTTGLMVWRKADNWTAFTNGYMTWISGPGGLVSRLNTQRFPWEADYGSPYTSAATSGTGPALPAFSHIFLILMENKEFGDIIGNPAAPYINALAGQYALAMQSYAVSHPSLPNYLALLGGSTFGVTSDCTTCFINAPNLPDQLESAGKSWQAYMEDLPTSCFPGPVAGGGAFGLGATYALKHDPFLYFDDIRNNPGRCGHVVPSSQFAPDLASGKLPDFAWVTPNLVDDMHDGTIAQGDAWLAGFVPRILASSAWQNNGLLIITWDEGSSNSGCCQDAAGGRIVTLAISPLGQAGYRMTNPISHYGILRTIEDAWGLGHLGHSGDAGTNTLAEVFRN